MAATKWCPRELALGKAQGTVIKYLTSLPADVNRNNVKAILRQQFPPIPTVTHAAMQLIHRYQQKGERLKDFNFMFGEIIQAVTNCEPKHITDPLKIYMYAQILFSPAISSKTIQHAHLTAESYSQCAEGWEKFLIGGRDSVDRICNVYWCNCWKWPKAIPKVTTITCHKCGQKGNYRKDCPNSTGTIPIQDQNLTYSPPTTVTQICYGFLYCIPV